MREAYSSSPNCTCKLAVERDNLKHFPKTNVNFKVESGCLLESGNVFMRCGNSINQREQQEENYQNVVFSVNLFGFHKENNVECKLKYSLKHTVN